MWVQNSCDILSICCRPVLTRHSDQVSVRVYSPLTDWSPPTQSFLHPQLIPDSPVIKQQQDVIRSNERYRAYAVEQREFGVYCQLDPNARVEKVAVVYESDVANRNPHTAHHHLHRLRPKSTPRRSSRSQVLMLGSCPHLSPHSSTMFPVKHFQRGRRRRSPGWKITSPKSRPQMANWSLRVLRSVTMVCAFSFLARIVGLGASWVVVAELLLHERARRIWTGLTTLFFNSYSTVLRLLARAFSRSYGFARSHGSQTSTLLILLFY